MLMPKAITYGISQDLPTLFHYASLRLCLFGIPGIIYNLIWKFITFTSVANNDLLLVSFAWTLPKLFAVSTGSRKIFLVT
ncbi:hypothetical protein Plhal304r1_c006g0022981 [Plasmopara halstedii]